MSTRKIIWEPGYAYHITTRGNRKDIIFKDVEDFQTYLKLLNNTLIYYSNFNYELVSYCLMTNHVHLIIKTDSAPLTRFMARLNSMYTKYFNKKYDYTGHLFQGKYFSDLIKSFVQLLEVSRYIHMNPVKAKIVTFPNEYMWSSYPILIGEKEGKLINTNILLTYFKYENRFEEYKNFVERSHDTPEVQ